MTEETIRKIQIDMQVFLVAFADPKYLGTLERLRGEAERMRVFDAVFCWSDSDIDRQFMDRHREFIDANPRGYGYWVWKAQVVKQALDMIPDNSILFYADAGCVMNHNNIFRLSEYCKLIEEHPSGRLVFELTGDHKEYLWTQKHTLRQLGLTDPEKLASPQLISGVFGIRKVPHNIAFVERFSAATQRYDLISDCAIVPNDPDFMEHRHDQSVWSVLNKMSDPQPLVLPDETYGSDEGPILARRLRY